MKYQKYLPIFIALLSFLVGLYFYPQLPSSIASHWDITGQVNGYSSKGFGVFFLPGLLVVLYFVFKLLPLTDPYKTNFKQFEKHFDNFINVIFLFLFYIYLLTIVWNLGHRFNMGQFMSPGMAGIFYYTGVLVSVAKRNWFVGFRTPWTMSSDKVWDKTHLVGGKLFKIVGLISLLGLFMPDIALYLVLVPVLLSSAFIFVYSYWLYRKYQK